MSLRRDNYLPFIIFILTHIPQSFLHFSAMNLNNQQKTAGAERQHVEEQTLRTTEPYLFI